MNVNGMIRAIEDATPTEGRSHFILSLSRGGYRQLGDELGDIPWTDLTGSTPPPDLTHVKLRLETGVFTIVRCPEQEELFTISEDI